ncbi:MAG: putative RNA-binding protein [Bacteroidetes bacterium]|nr:putative RNA-binding protein [Bacteroidota bacterium]
MELFKIKDEYIQLNQLIKAMGWCENGAEANNMIDAGLVKVNDVVEHRKRNKIVKGFIVEVNNQKVKIE